MLRRWTIRRGISIDDPTAAAGAGSTDTAVLDTDAVDARVRAIVADWAEVDNDDPIPADKLGNAPGDGGGGPSSVADVSDGRLPAAARGDASRVVAGCRFRRDGLSAR